MMKKLKPGGSSFATATVPPFSGFVPSRDGVEKAAATLDGIEGNAPELLRIAIRSMTASVESMSPPGGPQSLAAFVEALTLVYLATGTLLGARRDLMVKAIR